LVRWNIAERFHWPLDVVDSLSIADLHELMQIDDGRSKAHAEMAEMYKNRRGAK